VERETAAEEARRRAEEDEDDAMVRQYFAKVGGTNGVSNDNGKKGKGKAVDGDADHEDGDSDISGDEDDGEEDSAVPALTIKRRLAPGSGNGGTEPSVASLLAAKGKVLDGVAANGNGNGNGNGTVPGQVKSKREGMQKVLGIKKKVKA